MGNNFTQRYLATPDRSHDIVVKLETLRNFDRPLGERCPVIYELCYPGSSSSACMRSTRAWMRAGRPSSEAGALVPRSRRLTTQVLAAKSFSPTELDHNGDAAQLPMEEFGAGGLMSNPFQLRPARHRGRGARGGAPVR